MAAVGISLEIFSCLDRAGHRLTKLADQYIHSQKMCMKTSALYICEKSDLPHAFP